MILDGENKVRVYPQQIVKAYVEKYITDDYILKTNDEGLWMNFPSPFYNDSRTRLGINLDKGTVFDVKLGQGMDFEGFIVKHSKEVLRNNVQTKHKAMELLMKIRSELRSEGIVVDRPVMKSIQEDGAKSVDRIRDGEVPTGLKCFTKENVKTGIGQRALNYIMNRDFNLDVVNKYKLQYIDSEVCPVCNGDRIVSGVRCSYCNGWGKNKYHGRIYIPTYENGNLVYFQARDFIDRDDKWKYLNPSVPRKQIVYFYDMLPEKGRIFGPEGPVDAMYIEADSTALMGNKMSKGFTQKILWKKPKQFIFIPDFDEEIKTRKNIFLNLSKNINKLKEESDGKLDIGVYNWFNLTDKKDLNSARLKVIDDTRIIYPLLEPIKYKNMVREVLSRPGK